MSPILNIHTWVSLPNEVRYRIRSIFDIPRSSSTVVSDFTIQSDGTTVEDFAHLTIEKMQSYLSDPSSDFNKLFDKVVAKVSDEIEEETRPFIVTTPGMEVAKVIRKSNVKKNKNEKK